MEGHAVGDPHALGLRAQLGLVFPVTRHVEMNRRASALEEAERLEPEIKAHARDEMTDEEKAASSVAVAGRRWDTVEPGADRHDLRRCCGVVREPVAGVATVARRLRELDTVVHTSATVGVQGVVSPGQRPGAEAIGYEIDRPIGDLLNAAETTLRDS